MQVARVLVARAASHKRRDWTVGETTRAHAPARRVASEDPDRCEDVSMYKIFKTPKLARKRPSAQPDCSLPSVLLS